MFLKLLLPAKENTFSAKVYYWLILGFISTLYWKPTMIVTNIFTGLLFLSLFFFPPAISIKQLIKKKWFVLIMLLFCTWSIISVMLSANPVAGWQTLLLRLPLLLLAVSLGLLQLSAEIFDRVLFWFCLFTLAACLICFVFSFNQFLHTGNSAYLYNDALTAVLHKQSIYIATLVNVAIFCHIYLLQSPSFIIKGKAILYPSIIFLFISSFLLAGRNAMIVLFSFILIYALLHLIRSRKYLELVTLVMGLLITIVVMNKLLPKTLNRFRELAYTNYNYSSNTKEAHYADSLTAEQWNGANFRLAVWKCGWELAKPNLLTGAGLGDRKDKLFEIYKKKKFILAIQTNKNLHNQYLDILSSLGIIGLVLFLTGYVIGPFIFAAKQKNILAMAIILTFSIALVTDNFLDRSFSAIIFSFFIPFMCSKSN
jgi:O-antigen ligase